MENSKSLVDFAWRSSLVAKFASLTFIVVFMLMGIKAYINYQVQTNAIIENIKSQSEMLGSFVTSIAPEALLSYDFDALDNYMREINKGEDIVYAVIFSPEGDALTTHLEKRNRYIAEQLNKSNKVDIIQLVSALESNPEIIHQSFKIFFQNNLIGSFRVGISQNRIVLASQKTLINQIVVSLIMSALLAVGIFVVFRIYTMRPILQLMQGAQRIASGKLDQDVTVESQDELGRLAMMFNQMMRELKTNIKEKDDALNTVKEMNTSLEERVSERTQELETVNKKLEKLALHDSLTGLPNRFCIQDKLNNVLVDAKRLNVIFTVIMMDLDRFKEINDTLGHDCGDQLLVEVSKRLKDILRPSDFIGRLGGDEFAIILYGTNEDSALLVAKKLQKALEPSFYLSEMAFSISASYGIASFPNHGHTSSELLKAADVAMYYAKQNKLGEYVYDPVADYNTPDRLSLMSELRTAIQENQLELFFQPEVALITQRIVGVEALLRWNHPERGFIAPDVFIPLAEQTGLIHPLTQWVLRSAIRQREIWHDLGVNIVISINLSMYNLNDADFSYQLEILLEKTKVPNHYFEFEVTESAIMSDPAHVVKVLTNLGALDVSFAVDDFGTGYSSLSLLKKLPVHKLKIDKSFIMDMETDSDDAAIVHSVIDMAHILGLTVIAEGVENASVLKLLKSLECDLIQGYHVSRPLPAKDITPLLISGDWKGDGDTEAGGTIHRLR